MAFCKVIIEIDNNAILDISRFLDRKGLKTLLLFSFKTHVKVLRLCIATMMYYSGVSCNAQVKTNTLPSVNHLFCKLWRFFWSTPDRIKLGCMCPTDLNDSGKKNPLSAPPCSTTPRAAGKTLPGLCSIKVNRANGYNRPIFSK